MSELAWINQSVRDLDEVARTAALARQGQLTKPPGALGMLEEVAVRLAAMQGREKPQVDKVCITVFAADHGIAEEGVSAFPQEVTGHMIANFANGGAAISVLARNQGASLEVVDVGSLAELPPMPGVVVQKAGPGTANFRRGPAMSEAQLSMALAAGRDAITRAAESGASLFIGGEMGIANTSSATALACALTGLSAREMTGPGTGLNAAGVSHKAQVITEALALHAGHLDSPVETLRRLGGFEIAALAGAYLACAQRGLPVLVDGFIATSAALVAARIQPRVADWMFFGHTSAEPGYLLMQKALDARPLLNLGLRLGEGSGAATALPLLRLACALHNEMATFAEAGVAEKNA